MAFGWRPSAERAGGVVRGCDRSSRRGAEGAEAGGWWLEAGGWKACSEGRRNKEEEGRSKEGRQRRDEVGCRLQTSVSAHLCPSAFIYGSWHSAGGLRPNAQVEWCEGAIEAHAEGQRALRPAAGGWRLEAGWRARKEEGTRRKREEVKKDANVGMRSAGGFRQASARICVHRRSSVVHGIRLEAFGRTRRWSGARVRSKLTQRGRGR